jgi:hypothetical protein
MGDGGDDTNSGAGVGLLARQNRVGSAPRFFGKFDSQAQAEKWIAEHQWLTEQRKVARDAPEATPN